MDINIHIILLVLIGLFFFLDKYINNLNAMMFVLVFSLLGLFLIMNSSIELINYYEYNETIVGNVTNVKYYSTDLSNTGIGMINLQSFFVLAYVWFLFIAALRFGRDDKDSKS